MRYNLAPLQDRLDRDPGLMLSEVRETQLCFVYDTFLRKCGRYDRTFSIVHRPDQLLHSEQPHDIQLWRHMDTLLRAMRIHRSIWPGRDHAATTSRGFTCAVFRYSGSVPREQNVTLFIVVPGRFDPLPPATQDADQTPWKSKTSHRLPRLDLGYVHLVVLHGYTHEATLTSEGNDGSVSS